MSIEFKKQKSCSIKWSKKYPRTRINAKGGDRKAIIATKWYKINDTRFNSKLVVRFLRANTGKPVDKVFSEFLKRCDSKLRRNYSLKLKEEFYYYIKKKEDIGKYGGFYITNGILNYKKRVKYNYLEHPPVDKSAITLSKALDYNNNIMPKSKSIVPICEKANKTKSPQYLGNLCVYDRYNIVKKDVYIVDKDAYIPTFELTEVVGFGSGIRVTTFMSQSKYNNTDVVFSDREIWDNETRYKLMCKIKR